MNPPRGDERDSRRSFLLSSGGVLTSAWLASHWPAIAAAAHHARAADKHAAPAGFEFLSAADGADVDAIAAHIVPGGATPGAREAHAPYFIDRALATFFADYGAEFRTGLAQFQTAFRAGHGQRAFAGAAADEQIQYLKSVDRTPFFDIARMLTLLGMFAQPKYGGNYAGAGWKLIGFEDQHIFAPPFGYYDAEYAGFVPYPTEPRS